MPSMLATFCGAATRVPVAAATPTAAAAANRKRKGLVTRIAPHGGCGDITSKCRAVERPQAWLCSRRGDAANSATRSVSACGRRRCSATRKAHKHQDDVVQFLAHITARRLDIAVQHETEHQSL